MNTKELKDFESRENVFEKTIAGFWVYVNSWKEEEPEEFFEAFNTMDISRVELEKESVSLVINYRFDEPIEYVQTTLNVNFNEALIAQYHYLQTFDGEVMDDVLSFF